MCALGVVHLWDAPEVVERYLKAGDDSIRVAIQDAAWAAAQDATWAAARVAAQDAACSTRWWPTWITWDAAWAAQNRRLTRMLNKLLKEDA
jgi:hypothetical protein